MPAAATPLTDEDIEAFALMRAHAIALCIAGVAAAALTALSIAQVVHPGLTGDIAWLGAGRTRMAATALVVLGLLGNSSFIALYSIPTLARVVIRLRVGPWIFGLLNLVFAAPITVLALAGRLPQGPVLLVLSTLSASSGFGFFVSPLFYLPMWQTAALRTRLARSSMVVPVAQMVASVGLVVVVTVGGYTQLSQARDLNAGQLWLDALANSQGRLALIAWAVVFVGWAYVGVLSVLRRSVLPASFLPMGPLVKTAAVIGMLLPIPFIAPLWFATRSFSGPPALTPSESRGRVVFLREGCMTCHLPDADEVGFGPPLVNESGVRSTDWHFAHLYAPRAVTPRTPMPSFAHLFAGAADQPTQDARDLVMYLNAMGRTQDLGATEAKANDASKVRARRTGNVPEFPPPQNRADSLIQYRTYCVGCHGPKGEGDGPAAAGLRPRPANLAAHRYATEHAGAAIWNGVPGSAMSGWRNLPWYRVSALIDAVQSFGPQGDAGATQEPAERALGERVYAANCSQCHGEHGGGDGFSAASLPVAPANFQRQQPTLDYALQAIANGVEGTPMAPWGSRISASDMLAVAKYVRSFYAGGVR